MRIRDLIEELIKIEKDYGNLLINRGVELDIDIMNDNLAIIE